jgi:hypothetical protein
MYQIGTPVSRVPLRHPTPDCSVLFLHPRTATLIADCRNFRWHQFLHQFVWSTFSFGARRAPWWYALRTPGELLGAFGLSSVLLYVVIGGFVGGRVQQLGAPFFLMGIGAVLKRVRWHRTGVQAPNFWDWVRTVM